MRAPLAVAVSSLLLFACEGRIALPFGSSAPPPDLTAGENVGEEGMRRLSRYELDSVLADLLGDTSNSAQALLPQDTTDPFDNDFTGQMPSLTLITAAEQLAIGAADRVLADPVKRAAIVPCTPTGPSDQGCLRTVITSLGKRFLRRTLTPQEVNDYLSLQSLAIEANDFDVGVKLVIRTLMQEPEFLYRIEVGAPVASQPGVFKLSPNEVATRLSFFLWGTTPPDWLIDQAESGQLATKEQVRAAAAQLIADPKARARIERFHALWLGYWRLPHALDLTTAMQTESGALVDKVVFDSGSADYFDLFNSDQTYVNQLLADNYGMTGFTGGTGFAWTPYGSLPRKGLLGQGSVLSQGTKFADSSPTQRGIYIRTRLLCQTIPPPPPSVNADQPPTSANSSPCKVDRYSSHSTNGNCHSCHMNLDPVGFGLENYDKQGAWRTTDTGLPQCPIAGTGTIAGLPGGDKAFAAEPGLTDVLLQSGQFEQCIVTQVYRFAMGRREQAADQPLISNLTTAFKANGRVFNSMLLDFVSDETFTYRKQEP